MSNIAIAQKILRIPHSVHGEESIFKKPTIPLIGHNNQSICVIIEVAEPDLTAGRRQAGVRPAK